MLNLRMCFVWGFHEELELHRINELHIGSLTKPEQYPPKMTEIAKLVFYQILFKVP